MAHGETKQPGSREAERKRMETCGTSVPIAGSTIGEPCLLAFSPGKPSKAYIGVTEGFEQVLIRSTDAGQFLGCQALGGWRVPRCQLEWQTRLGLEAKAFLDCLTFDVRGGLRLAARRPFDGGVRPRRMSSERCETQRQRPSLGLKRQPSARQRNSGDLLHWY